MRQAVETDTRGTAGDATGAISGICVLFRGFRAFVANRLLGSRSADAETLDCLGVESGGRDRLVRRGVTCGRVPRRDAHCRCGGRALVAERDRYARAKFAFLRARVRNQDPERAG